MRHILSALLLSMLSLSVCAAPQALNRIAAIVDEDVVLESEVEQRTADIQYQYRNRQQTMPPVEILRKQVVEQLIVQRIQLSQAERAGVRVDDNSLNASLTDIANQNGLSLADFRAKLESEQAGAYQQVREQIREEMMISRLRNKRVGDRIRISEQDISNFLASPQSAIALESEFRLAHLTINVPSEASPQQWEAAKIKSEQALAELQQGKPFFTVVTEYSNAEDALQGGDLGWRKVAQLPNLFAEAADKLNKGQFSAILQSPAGYHIVTVIDKRGAQQMLIKQRHVRHILIKPSEIMSLEDAKQKADELHERLLKGADFAELAQTYSEDTGSARNGGDLNWVSAGDMVPAFEDMMNKTAINGISPVFESQFGWHILQVLAERDQDMTEQYRRSLARQALYARQFDEERVNWLRELRAEAFVEIKDGSEAKQ
ncbi:peptidylprolyl isomerase [Agitococcus lubricus]|uniref:Chaperone SurA n=1 Tax=Agitococcus lubricus TaxID=1077255 RepID=A0A2T5J191_9GAMM|nr:peptidylprolyl isomerase [Agitococcus lubricus]PTQ90133.1 periplasmic chaperone for outer membrane proteins SurA [Agitococcus lubricus]